MRHLVCGAVISGVTIALAPLVVWAVPTQVTGVKVNPTSSGVEVVLQTQAGEPPQVFTSGQGNSWTANITNVQLRSPQPGPIRQENPAPGIASISITPSGANSIQVTVTGSGFIMGQVTQQDPTRLTLSLIHSATSEASRSVKAPSAQAQTTSAPAATNQPAAAPPNGSRTAAPTIPVPAVPPTPAAPTPIVPPAPTTPTPTTPTPTTPAPTATPAPAPATPTPATTSIGQPTPPENRLNYTDLNVVPVPVDLGTTARIERVVLRETPVREALALLARAADLGIIYAEDLATPSIPGTASQATGSAINSNISLDIENEPIQDVFNYILRAKGLKANRVGRTIFIGQNLPATAGSYISRTLRLNQMRATLPQTNLTSTMTSASSLTSGGAQGGSTATSLVGRNSTLTENVPYRGALQILEELGANGSPTARSPVLRGLQATADSRTNTLTLLGTLDLVQLATDYLTRLDVRRKQVAVNVRIVEVDLTKTSNIGASFSFGVADNFFNVNQGQATANVGPYNPALAGSSNSLTSPTTIVNPFAQVQPPLNINAPIVNAQGNTLGYQPASPINANPLAAVVSNLTGGSVNASQNLTTILNPVITYGLSPLFQFPTQFLLRLQAQVVSGNAKILTDPTLIVQEGNQSQVNLTSQVFSGFTEQRVVEGNVATTRILPLPPIDVGIILNVNVDQIDDNNFITLAVSPEVSSPGQQITDPSRNNLLIQQLVNRRRLETGKVRLRNGQTLILTGIIQEVDRTVITKTPILGDIPIINLLFRNKRQQRDRNEVVVLVTPQILDDSDRSPYGYNYLPGSEVQRLLQRSAPTQPAPVQPPTAPQPASPVQPIAPTQPNSSGPQR